MKRAVALLLVLSGCGAATPAVRTEDEPEEPPRYAIALRFEESAPSADGSPQTQVSLVRITPDGERTVQALATESGACYLEGIPGPLLAARCWWGGAGARYTLERRGDSVIALRGGVDEESGAAELREIARVEVPGEAALDIVGPDGVTSAP